MTTSKSSLLIVENNNNVGIIRLNRPDKLNAISPEMMVELVESLKKMDNDNAIGCILITGNDKAFAAGADIEHMAKADSQAMLKENPFYKWDEISQIKKPIIALISGYCFGGGCELALMCDLVLASETAVFSQPEINLGIIPGAGGTQRLIKRIGLNKAMEMILTGSRLKAQEAKALGLVLETYPEETYFNSALELAQTIADKPRVAAQLAKQLLWQTFDMPLKTGIQVERQAFYALFDSDDKKEGMAAFLEKRPAKFSHQK